MPGTDLDQGRSGETLMLLQRAQDSKVVLAKRVTMVLGLVASGWKSRITNTGSRMINLQVAWALTGTLLIRV